MQERFPDRHAGALADACRCRLALVQVPPRGVWGPVRAGAHDHSGGVARPAAGRGPVHRRRRPALPGGVRAGHGRRRRGLVAAPRPAGRARAPAPRLRTFRDERGRELLDLPDAPRPDPDTPAPPRFLPEYDNLLLSHADRARIVSGDDRARLSAAGGTGSGSVLVDGLLRAIWRVERDRGSGDATLVVTHTGIAKRAAASVAAEGRRLLRLVAADAPESTVRLVAAP
jgi:Winged helix DNA-binding domain